MTPAQASKVLKRLDDGSPVVTLMGDPLTAGSFVSLVEKGANGRRIKAVKADDTGSSAGPIPPPAGPNAAEGPTSELDLGQSDADHAAGGSWFLNMFKSIFQTSTARKGIGGPVQASKDGDTAIDFNSAIAPAEVYDNLWRGFDALRTSLVSILQDKDVADKGAAWTVALAQFTRWTMGLVDRIPATKRAEAAVEIVRQTVSKEGRVHSAATLAKIRAVIEANQAALAQLAEMEAAAAAKETATKVDETPGDDMNPKVLIAVAREAGDQAVTVLKALKPTANAAEIQTEFDKAYERVIKMAVTGPAQPAIPTGELERQLAGHTDGQPGNPMDRIMAALNSIQSTVTKLDTTINGSKDDKGNVVDPGLVAVVQKQAEVQAAMSTTVATVTKALDLPAAPRSGDEGGGEPARRTTARKDGSFAGTALDFGGEVKADVVATPAA